MPFDDGISSLLVDFISLIRKLLFCLYLADGVCQMKVPRKLIKDYFLLCLAFLSNNAILSEFKHDLLSEALSCTKTTKRLS